MLPKVDVLMLVYNHEKTLSKAISSVLNQDLVDINLIITNDASTDKSQSIINSFSQKNIKCLERKNNLGPAINAEYLLDSVESEYVAFLEGDDMWTSKTKLIDQIQSLKKGYSFCYTSYTKKNKNDLIAFDYELKEVSGSTLIRSVIDGKINVFHINTLLLKSIHLKSIRSKYSNLFYDRKISSGDLRFFCTLTSEFKGFYLNQNTLVYNFSSGISSSKTNLSWRLGALYSKFKISWAIFGLSIFSSLRLLKLIYFAIKVPFLKIRYNYI